MQLFHLPTPPSVNNLFVNVSGAGRVKSKAYRDWLTEAGHKLNLQRPKRVEGPVRVNIIAARPHAGRDLDNIIKPTLDLLVKHGVLSDDRHVLAIAAEWQSRELGGMSVCVTTLGETNAESIGHTGGAGAA